MNPRKRNRERITVLRKPYWRMADAREVLALWQRSGTSLSAFARLHSLDRNRLARWRDRLDRRPTPRFHEVRLVDPLEPPVRPGGTTPGEKPGIELIIGGRRLVVHRGFDGDLLAEVVQVLEAMAC